MKRNLLLFLFLCFALHSSATPTSVYDFKIAAFKGADIDLSAYRGKKVLIVNAPCMSVDDIQYRELEALYQQYKGKLVVIGILTYDFNIAPGTKMDRDYHKMDYKVTFPLSTRVQVSGPEQAPLFQWLTHKELNKFKDSYVKWNFQKYLLDENGKLIAVFDPKVRPLSKQVTGAIEQ